MLKIESLWAAGEVVTGFIVTDMGGGGARVVPHERPGLAPRCAYVLKPAVEVVSLYWTARFCNTI